MKPMNEDDVRIATEAARWQHALARGGVTERAQFCAWVKISPRHLQEFLLMEALDAASEGIDPQRRIDTTAGVGTADNIVPLVESDQMRSAPSSTRGNRRIYAAAAAIAVIAVVALAIGSQVSWDGWRQYTTAIGEQRALELNDGSVVQLNTKSRIAVRLNVRERELRLLEGEALFKAAPDATRPFRVFTGLAFVRAVGTQFNISLRSGGETVVTVLEGRVHVEPHPLLHSPHPDGEMLEAGESLRIDSEGAMKREATDMAQAAAWRQRRLVFREETLASIAAEFNRYNRSPQIVVEGNEARNARYGGTFDADDPESLVQFVQTKGRLSVEHKDDRIVIRLQRPAITHSAE